MNFRKGDRVKFLNDVGKGTIIDLIDKEMVLVQTDDGFEYPVLIKELIITDQQPEAGGKTAPVVSRNREKFSEPAVDSSDEKSEIDRKEGPLLVYLGIIPTDPINPLKGKLGLQLINDSCFQLLFHIGKGADLKVNTIKAGYLEPDTKIDLGEFRIQDLTEKENALFFQVIAYRNIIFTIHEPLSAKIQLDTAVLKSPGSYKKNKFIKGNAIILSVEQTESRKMKMSLDDFKNAMIAEKAPEKDQKKPATNISQVHSGSDFQEIDLHIEQITDKSKGLSSGEIIEIQLARFRTTLAGAILANEKRIVFIHGIGAGKLKSEIRKIIDKEYPTCLYQDASFKEYGYGATLIIIK